MCPLTQAALIVQPTSQTVSWTINPAVLERAIHQIRTVMKAPRAIEQAQVKVLRDQL
jgi:hypothetical protein